MNKKRSILSNHAFYLLIAIILGFLAGAIMLLAVGVSPITAYGKLLESVFSRPKFIVWSMNYATPLILTGLAVAFSFKMGVFNIGAEGQFVVGSMAACAVGVLVDVPAVLHVPLCILAAISAGAAWALIVAYLKIKRGINEVLSFIMFNWIAFYLSNFMVNLKVMHKVNNREATKNVLDSARIFFPENVRDILGCSSANYGFILAIILAVIIWFILKKTTLGYTICAVGYNINAAKYCGIHTNRITLTAIGISGGLAGLGGAVQLLGMTGRLSKFAGQEGFGFQGITVALIGASNPIGCIFSGLFYGAMKYGGSKLSLIDVPTEIVDIIMGMIILLIGVSYTLKSDFLKRVIKKEAE
ncbi:ABC transporter permease [Anaerosacchariphilus polymeriproducens]|uniref:ABC transporter permease n=1 Tax=Anaerosacchariphilus polymeriproducens TaxID=1812858 RepID=A0A371AZ97_9FIRM|nr:ABC transporter permease [Anaerosacchariphilus polymeriproducens]RDU24876.1 ABC transporter permease [Anaerosacchariphilus polymeriproducens]